MKKAFSLIGLLIFLIACGEDSREKENSESATLSFTLKTIEKTLNNCKPENGDCAFISLQIPVVKASNDVIAENINKKVKEFLNNSIDFKDEETSEEPEVLAENFIKNYQETATEFPDEQAWEATIIGKKIFQKNGILSLQFKNDIFTGGAHGYRSVHYLNFNLENGQKLSTKELFSPEFKQRVETDFRKARDIPENANINSTGLFFENDEFHLPANIGFNGKTLILQYNAYEIDSYASGEFKLTYPLEEIEEFIVWPTKSEVE